MAEIIAVFSFVEKTNGGGFVDGQTAEEITIQKEMAEPRAQTRRVRRGENEPSAFLKNAIELAQRPQLIGQMLHAFLKQNVISVVVGDRQLGFQISGMAGQPFDFEKFRVKIVRFDIGAEVAQDAAHFPRTSGKIDDDLTLQIFERMKKVLNVGRNSAAPE